MLVWLILQLKWKSVRVHACVSKCVYVFACQEDISQTN